MAFKIHYYTTQAVRGPITKINQSKCAVAGPIYSKYWTGHCPKCVVRNCYIEHGLVRMCPFLLNTFVYTNWGVTSMGLPYHKGGKNCWQFSCTHTGVTKTTFCKICYGLVYAVILYKMLPGFAKGCCLRNALASFFSSSARFLITVTCKTRTKIKLPYIIMYCTWGLMGIADLNCHEAW